ncbi:MAG: prolyl oligopeptidase family serine peptidase [Oligoflexia bacterium]|nr:prolyl oligopeptidase family serine peptidase [Oligoflexia bacterium]
MGVQVPPPAFPFLIRTLALIFLTIAAACAPIAPSDSSKSPELLRVANTSTLTASAREIFRELLEARLAPSDLALRTYGNLIWAQDTPGARHPLLWGIKDGKRTLLWDPNSHLSDFTSAELGVVRMRSDLNALAFSADLFHQGHYQAFVLSPLSAKPQLIGSTSEDIQDLQWADRDTLCFLVRHDLRADELRCAPALTPQLAKTIFREHDQTYALSIQAVPEGRALIVRSASTQGSQHFLLGTKHGQYQFKALAARRSNILERASWWGNQVALLAQASSRAPTIYLVGENNESKELLLGDPASTVEAMLETTPGLLLLVRSNGLPQLMLLSDRNNPAANLVLDDPAFTSLELLPEPGTLSDFVFVRASAPDKPPHIIRLQLSPSQKAQTQVVSAPSPLPFPLRLEQQLCRRTDGKDVPLTLLRRADQPWPRQIVLQAYGAYGAITGLNFEPTQIPLLRRGFAIATAQVRGGGIRGNSWWKDGAGANKQHTFEDYLACAEMLRDSKQVTTIIGRGRSAGGLTVASSALRRPDLFDALVLDKPFLNVIDFVNNISAPLRDRELSEWGDPSIASQRVAISSYSPYPFPAQKRFPPTLVVTSRKDEILPAQVAADWAQQVASAGNSVELRIGEQSTHSSSADDIEGLEEEALIQNYILERSEH